MKKIFKYMAAALLAVNFTSCSDFLDKEVDLTLDAEQVFQKFENTRGYLANIYTYLPDAFVGYTDGQFRGASRDCMTDNALSFWSVHYYHSVLTDAYSATKHSFAEDFWPKNFKGIRAANNFLKYARESVVKNTEMEGDDNRLYDRYMAEARLLRAIFHFDQASWFGDIPIVGEDENGEPIIFEYTNPEQMNMARTNCADALKWIADECDKIKDVLPFRYAQEELNWGRVNGAAAYALKARALLYRASPLHNPNNDASLWREAATAATDFITKNRTQSNPYRLYTTADNDTDKNYYECFVSTPHLNNEYILSRSEWQTREIELFLAPCGFSGSVNSTGRTNPTQNLVDSYETKNGLPIDKDPSYDPQNPYANRDPRLEQTILHHGSIWGDAKQDEEREVDVTYGSGKDYHELHGGTLTGYYTKKFLNNMSFKSPTTYTHACPIFRYAEVLLGYVEAMNEMEGSYTDEDGQVTVTRDVDQMVKYFNQIRYRAGQPGITTADAADQSRMRELIKHERRIEFACEGRRYHDLRRWGDAMEAYNRPISGCNVKARSNERQKFYTTTILNDKLTRRSFSYKHYFYPIPKSVLDKNKNLVQNPEWR